MDRFVDELRVFQGFSFVVFSCLFLTIDQRFNMLLELFGAQKLGRDMNRTGMGFFVLQLEFMLLFVLRAQLVQVQVNITNFFFRIRMNINYRQFAFVNRIDQIQIQGLFPIRWAIFLVLTNRRDRDIFPYNHFHSTIQLTNSKTYSSFKNRSFRFNKQFPLIILSIAENGSNPTSRFHLMIDMALDLKIGHSI